MTGPRDRLRTARLYLCTPVREARFLDAVLGAGVDVVQLRDKDASDAEIVRASEVFRDAASRHGALFIVNDRPDLALASGADGVHLGQDDGDAAAARALLGPNALIGRSTHTEEEIDRALGEPVDYLGVGPVEATPTKPGRPGVGLGLVGYAARTCRIPFFVTGGVNASTAGAIRDAGATGFVVVRAITEAADPAEAVRAIRRATG